MVLSVGCVVGIYISMSLLGKDLFFGDDDVVELVMDKVDKVLFLRYCYCFFDRNLSLGFMVGNVVENF